MTELITCPFCGAENKSDFIFCEKCGFRLPDQSETTENETPDWLADLRSSSTNEESWNDQEISAQNENQSFESEDISDDATPDWLSRLRERKSSDEQYEQLKKHSEKQDTGSESGSTDNLVGAFRSEERDEWLSKSSEEFLEEDNEQDDGLDSRIDEIIGKSQQHEDLPNWLSNLDKNANFEKSSEEIHEKDPEHAQEEIQVPDWIKSTPLEDIEHDKRTTEEEVQIPDWLDKSPGESVKDEDKQDTEDIPSWLTSEIEHQQTTEVSETPDSFVNEVPDWLENLPEEYSEKESKISKDLLPTRFSEQEELDTEKPDTFSSEIEVEREIGFEKRDLLTDDSSVEDKTTIEDASISTSPFSFDEIPEWLSEMETADEEEKSDLSDNIEELPEEADIKPGNLPTWLNALRPVEAVAPKQIRKEDRKKIEKTGPLAGLQGVLSSEDAVSQYSPPPTYSIRLNISDRQKINAGILESVFSQQKQPTAVPEKSSRIFNALIRLVLPVLLITVLVTSFFIDSTTTPLPVLFPAETVRFATLSNGLLQNQVDSHILLVIDADLASLAELRFTSQDVIESFMQQNSYLSVVTSNPDGLIVAESIARAANRNQMAYNTIERLIFLGYLPGNEVAIRSFMVSPQTTIPTTINKDHIWDQQPYSIINSISDFQAIYLITDNAESGKRWIEQLRISDPDQILLVSTSAQSAPLLKPYVDSEQIDGMISGLYGSISYNQVVQNDIGYTRNYWSAYQLGISTFILFILIGGAYKIFQLAFQKM